jgi:hypothetical protein
MHFLPFQLGASACLFLVTILTHVMGLTALTSLGSFHLTRARAPWLALDRILIPTLMVYGLVLLHGVEIATYAFAFRWLGATPNLGDAIYFSVASYSTADVAQLDLKPHWREVGALESLNGILLIGWSTAYLFQNMHRILNSEGTHPFPAGAIAAPSPRSSRSGRRAPPGTNSNETELMQ